jgi:type I restriction enzyme R subunit
LINTYIQADAPTKIGDLTTLSLTEAIIETGIHDAIARKLNQQGKLPQKAIAEGIINNVRKTIIREQLTDPKFYEQMSKLLEDLIDQTRSDALAYEDFLRKAEELVQKLAAKQPQTSLPAALHGNAEATVLYNNLDSLPATTFRYPTDEEDRASLALKLDLAVRERAPAGWKGDAPREVQVKNAIFPLLDRDREATQALFEIIKNQPGY